jgi:hypothetical protein
MKVTVGGQTVASAADVYQGFRAARRELRSQLEALQSQRDEITSELTNSSTVGVDKKGLETRLTQVDQRIADLDKAIADADAQVAKAAAVPGATVEPPSPPRSGPPEEVWVLGGMFMVIVLLPMSIAYARRIWRRSAKIVTTIPKELMDKLAQVEQTVEASAIEIERIGEGQRFMTRLFTEVPAQGHALPSAQPVGIQASRPGDVRP